MFRGCAGIGFGLLALIAIFLAGGCPGPTPPGTGDDGHPTGNPLDVFVPDTDQTTNSNDNDSSSSGGDSPAGNDNSVSPGGGDGGPTLPGGGTTTPPDSPANSNDNGGSAGGNDNGSTPPPSDGSPPDDGGDTTTPPDEPAPNTPPVAALTVSPTGSVSPGTMITLNASPSSDADGDPLQFAWRQVSGPAASFDPNAGAVLQFAAPFVVYNGSIRFAVTVSDGRGGEASVNTSINIVVSDEFAGHSQSLLPYRNALTSDEAYHVLRRAAFGASPSAVALAMQRGLNATVSDLLTIHPDPPLVAQLTANWRTVPFHYWMAHLLNGSNPLLDRIALFWHDRFATGRSVLNASNRELAVIHLELLRRNALGNYRVFLEELTLDPLMLMWLNGAENSFVNPNENYAREFWELFSLGRDVLYTESDVREAAKAFTGIVLVQEHGQLPRTEYNRFLHDNSLKSIFPGRAAPAHHDYLSVIDLTLAQPEAARYVARNLFVFLIHDHPSDGVVQELADVFTAANFEIVPVVEVLLKSQAMFSPDARFNQISSPLEHFIGVARTLDMHLYDAQSYGTILDRLTEELTESGFEPLNPPGVEGWGEDEYWLRESSLVGRIKALGRYMNYGPNHLSYPYHLLPPASTWTELNSVHEIVGALAPVFHLELDPFEHMQYVSVLNQDDNFQFRFAQADYRIIYVQDLIRLMSMHEKVIGR